MYVWKVLRRWQAITAFAVHKDGKEGAKTGWGKIHAFERDPMTGKNKPCHGVTDKTCQFRVSL